MCYSHTKAAVFSGKITDQDSKPLAYVSVYVKGESIGTSTNAEGIFKLNLEAKEYTIVVKLVGYQLVEQNISLQDGDLYLPMSLKEENYLIGEVSISKNKIDPAIAIINEAQIKREYYLKKEIASYSCRSYVKALARVGKAEIKNKLMGIKLFDIPNIPQNKVIYFSESVSDIQFKNPDVYKERMKFSKVSGQAKGYSFATAFAMLSEVNFYRNNLPFGDIYERPFVSPIAQNSFKYYDFQLIDSFREQGYLIHKIKVIPIQKQSPLFNGYIYITDQTWRIHSVNLTIDKSIGIDYIDTLSIQQTYAPQKDSIWVVINQKFNFKLSADFGIAKGDGSGYVIGIFSNYKIEPLNKPIPSNINILETKKLKKSAKKRLNNKTDFIENKNEVLVIDNQANKADSTQWKELRPIALTSDEIKDYREKDSIEVIKNTQAYKDSVDEISNRFKPSNLVFGYTYRNSYRKKWFSFRPMFNNVQFNTVEGWVLNPNFMFMKRFEDGKFFKIEPFFRYGFSNAHFNAKIEMEYHYNPLKWASIKLSLGKFVQDFNPLEPLTPFVNSIYTLALRQNYLKLYEKAFVKIEHGSEIFNGIYLAAGVEYAQRYALNNSTNFSFHTNKGIEFTPNNPAAPNQNLFADSKAFTLNIGLRFTFAQKYLSYPNRKIPIDNEFPKLTLNYRKGIYGLLGSDVNFDYLSLKIENDFNFNKIGEAELEIQSGLYINNSSTYFADYKHFNGNRTLFARSELSNKFWLLDYYLFSTNRYYVEAHWEHHFNGWITNKIPILKKLKWQLVSSANYLYNDLSGNYIEAGLGFENIFKFFRVDYAVAHLEKSGFRQGVRIGVSF